MRLLGKLGLAVVACLFGAKLAAAETTVKWLHIEANPAQVKIWEEVARAYEGSHPGVKVEMQFLENEAYKAKLPTILQSRDRPNIIYSWSGGVLKTQIEAGVLDDITDSVKGYSDSLTPAALAAFTSNGRVYGLPTALSQVGFLCNKELMAKAKVDPAGIKSWDDLLAAVKTLKSAGVTPIVVGGADKWPLHFYWTLLLCASAARRRSMRRCVARTAALPGKPSRNPASCSSNSWISNRSRMASWVSRTRRRSAISATARRR